jgi:murein DD-endopeptidase MepM/ murein hydrolase activator NlpD
MAQEGPPRRKKKSLFEIVVVPLEEGARAKTFHASRLKLVLLLAGAVALVVALTLSVLVFTPLALYVPIPNPELEARYGKMIKETQERLAVLAKDVLLLRDYNQQLRSALGEGNKDSSAATGRPVVSAAVDTGGKFPTYTPGERGPVPEYDEVTDGSMTGFANVVTTAEEGRFRFPLMLPTDGYLTQSFDPERNHFGMDLAGKRGTPVYAAADGHVVFAGWTYQDGNMVILQHGGGFVTVYKHNQSLLRSVQAHVTRGEAIALLGSSGKTSLGPHLHFEVWKDGIPRNPDEYLLTPARGQ